MIVSLVRAQRDNVVTEPVRSFPSHGIVAGIVLLLADGSYKF